MATSLNVGEEAEHIKGDFVDLLTCSICFEIFKQPKYLPCLHTFCETCISSYIVSKAKGNNLKGFKCPVCRRFIPMGDNLKNPETWARSLPGNYFVVSMMDRKAMKKTEKLCDTCSGKNVSKEAISWCTVCEEAYCDTCEDYHRSYKMARNHKIVPIKDMHEETPISNSCASVTCDEHPEKTIEIYCKDHTQPCCTICATVHHRKCEQVVAIDKAVSGVKESKKAQELMNKLNETGKKLDGVIKKRNHYTTNFKKEIAAVLMEVANMRQKINEKLNKIENKIKDEINGARKENLLRLSEDSTELLTLKSKFDHWKNIFETCLSEGSELQCFVKLEEISRKIPKFEKDLSTVIQGIRDISVKFEATEIVSDTVRFGNLHYNEKRPSFLGLKTVNVHTEKIKVLFTIDIRGSFISGIFFNDDIIITDHDKKTVVNHEKNGKQTDKLNISKPPTDITKVNDCTVAVSSNTEKIFIINVKPLTLVKTLDSSVPLWGLCLVDNQYITARNGTISWLNAETGAKIKQIQTTSSDTRFVTSYEKAVTVRFLTRRFIGEYNSNMDLIYKSSIKQEDYVTDIEILDSCAKKNTSIAPGDNVITWTDAFIVVYDICVHSSFEQAIKILDIINKARASVYCPALLLGNKTDLEHRRTVGVEEGHQAALEYNCQYYEVSAADDFVTISIAFQALLRETKIIQQNKPLLKRRKSSLVNVSKKLGAMFGKKDSEMDRKRSTCDVAGPKTIFEKA